MSQPAAGAPALRAGPPALVVTLDLFSVAIGVEVSDAAAAARVAELVAGHPRTTRAPEQTLRLLHGGNGLRSLYEGGRVVREAMSGPEAVAMLAWSLNQAAMTTRRCVVLHAGCVVRGGRGLVLSGPMEAGKSTLVTALVQRGWTYLSDELAGVGLADGQLLAYPCPIHLDPGSFPLFPELEPRPNPEFRDPRRWDLAPAWLPSAVEPRPVAPGAIVFPRFRAGESCRVEPVGSTEALRLLCSQTLNLPLVSTPGFQALARLVRQCPAFRLRFGRLDHACAALAEVEREWEGRTVE